MGENLTSYSSNKGLIFRMYRELRNFNPQRINTPKKKWAHELSKEEIQIASRYMKKCSTFLVIKEKQIKTTLRFHLIPLEWPESRVITANAGEYVLKQESIYTAGGNANYFNRYGDSSKN
jgi:hypothetical protein